MGLRVPIWKINFVQEFCGFPSYLPTLSELPTYLLSSSESRKTLEQKFIFTIYMIYRGYLHDQRRVMRRQWMRIYREQRTKGRNMQNARLTYKDVGRKETVQELYCSKAWQISKDYARSREIPNEPYTS